MNLWLSPSSPVVQALTERPLWRRWPLAFYGLVVTVCLALCGLQPTWAQSRQSASALASTGPVAVLPVVPPVQSCAALLDTDLTDLGGRGSRLTRAEPLSADGVALCEVQGVLAPAIGFVVRLPMTGWTQRYLQLGCGGLCGRLDLQVAVAQGCLPVAQQGLVLASTDMGHSGPGGDFGRDPQARADFAHRGVHLTALAAKKLIHAFYGQAPRHAYFDGCSDGGREALIEAQRYPTDFNGIVAGAAALNFQVQNGLYHAWQARANQDAQGRAILTADRLPVLHRAVLAACDGLDGLQDGLISDPRACHFDPGVLQCPPAPSPANTDCLSAAEVRTVRQLYDGPRDPATGMRLTVGGPQPGSELAWAGVFVPQRAEQSVFSERIAREALTVVYDSSPGRAQDPPTLAELSFDLAQFERLQALHPLNDATQTDLTAFEASGGKLILWHGWSDPHISPLNSLAYHEGLVHALGASRVQGFERLYLLPGVYHCGGGEGPSAIDLLTPLMNWVEQGLAPGRIEAHAAPAQVGAAPAGSAPGAAPQAAAVSSVASRPVDPYPQVTRYLPGRDPSLASSFVATPPDSAWETPAWAGSAWLQPQRLGAR